MSDYTATYSPDDNKLRLYALSRLPKDLYERVRSAGFIWAAKQDLFVAPMWTPEREDFLLELCEEIQDEDKSLTERAEERAERFDDYKEKRAADALRSRDAVAVIADNIPLGQPILVGHHSEKHARRDAEKIENGMRRTIRLFETSQYWKDRAAGALRHAKYKERPDVRARRIKGLEAEQRKKQRNKAAAEKALETWRAIVETPERFKRKDGQPTTLWQLARYVANYSSGVSQCYPLDKYPRQPPASQYEGSMSLWSALGDTPEQAIITPEQAQEIAVRAEERQLAWAQRWLDHLENRLTYERAMLAEDGGTQADKKGPEKGGACRCWASPRGGWSYIQKVNKVSVTVLDSWGNGGKHFTRTITMDKLAALMTRAEVDAARAEGRIMDLDKDPAGAVLGFLLADWKARDPEPPPPAPPIPPAKEDLVCPDGPPCPDPVCKEERQKQGLLPLEIEGMRQSLKAGVQVAVAPQLFPTPKALAERMASIVSLGCGMRVLEPSAGTGRILDALLDTTLELDLAACEIRPDLAEDLRRRYPTVVIRCADFLETVDERGFDRIIMNPPFQNGSDIKHIKHALGMLKPGGQLVALCANGPRQREELKPLCCIWEELEDAFQAQGTGVRVALAVFEKEEEEKRG